MIRKRVSGLVAATVTKESEKVRSAGVGVGVHQT